MEIIKIQFRKIYLSWFFFNICVFFKKITLGWRCTVCSSWPYVAFGTLVYTLSLLALISFSPYLDAQLGLFAIIFCLTCFLPSFCHVQYIVSLYLMPGRGRANISMSDLCSWAFMLREHNVFAFLSNYCFSFLPSGWGMENLKITQ